MRLGRLLSMMGAVVVIAACGEPPAFAPTAPVAVAVAPLAAQEPVVEPLPATLVAPTPAPGGSVRADNQRHLGHVAVSFARYLNAMHERIHPHFSDDGLGQLKTLSLHDPLNDPKLVVRVEIVIDGTSGAVARVGVVAPSGRSAFDVLAVDAVMQAGPFATPAAELRSADGNVYVHWQFARDEVFACSTMHARPYLLASVGPGT